MRLVLTLIVGVLLAGAPAAHAAQINVDTPNDVVSNDGTCSLREAISSANLDSAPFNGPGECEAGVGADTVVLAAGPPFVLAGAARENANASGDLDVMTTVTVRGAGASSTTIDAGGVDRVIDVLAAGNLTLQGVTVTGGRAPDGLNAGTTGTGSNGSPGGPGGLGAGTAGDAGESGGGVRSAGTLTVVDSTVTGNRTGDGRNGGSGFGGFGSNGANGVQGGAGLGGAGGAGGSGGGIFSTGSLTLTRAVVTANTTGTGGIGGAGTGGQGGAATGSEGGPGGGGTGGAGGAGGGGGGVAATSGTVTIDQSSIRANTAGLGGHGGLGQGGQGGVATGASARGGLSGSSAGGTGGAGGSGGGIRAFATGAQQISRSLIDGNTAGTGGVGGTGSGTTGGAALPATGTGTGGAGSDGTGGTGGDGGAGAGVDGSGVQYANVTITANTTGTGGKGGPGTGGKGGNSSPGTGGNGGPGLGGTGGNAGQGAVSTNATTTILHATLTANGFGQPGDLGSGTAGAAGSPGGSTGSAANGQPGSAGAGGAVAALAQTTISDSIVAANGMPACVGAPADGGHNISLADATCPGANTDPLLAALAANGGPTLTRKPGATSPALDIAPVGTGCAATDARLVVRPQGAGCDAGAYEVAPPSPTPGDPSAITQTSVTLGGTVNPNAQAASVHFEFGTTTAYGSATPAQNLPAGVDAAAVSAPIDGLAPGTTFHFRLVATNADGTSASSDRTFTTALPGGAGSGGGGGTGGGGDGAGGGGGADKIAPVFLSASMKPSVFAVNRKGVAEKPAAARVARGTQFRYRLSEAARVVFTIERRKGKRFIRVGRFAARAKAGANTRRFTGRIGKRALTPGRYRAVLVATDAAGNHSKARRLSFRVVRAGR